MKVTSIGETTGCTAHKDSPQKAFYTSLLVALKVKYFDELQIWLPLIETSQIYVLSFIQAFLFVKNHRVMKLY